MVTSFTKMLGVSKLVVSVEQNGFHMRQRERTSQAVLADGGGELVKLASGGAVRQFKRNQTCPGLGTMVVRDPHS